ncbi:hypothetical protein D8674_017943 [Pyrus ussuriensis x Pyrus communis]|uniref:Uncharacterized protein n=1 Tax=Pyrus ussuriensis x Pyrus communis TaxID=2448454 RepID=A0A5N5HI53_9ROSA|nr:hypothetical protein D8674_017943 [Pyrus ussuriensis x Pyrus communis]
MAKPYGRWFGLDSDGALGDKALSSEELDNLMDDAADEPMLCGENVTLVPQPLLLFGTEITPRVGDNMSAQEVNEAFTGNLALSFFVRDDSSLSLGSDPFNLALFIFGPGAKQGHRPPGTEAERHKSWSLLQHLWDTSNLPWCCIGDFNEVLQVEEQEGGDLQSERQMEDFQNGLTCCQLQDLGFIVQKWQKPDFGWIKCKFDAAWDEIESRGGIGIVVRNSEGKFIAAMVVRENGIRFALHAENEGTSHRGLYGHLFADTR